MKIWLRRIVNHVRAIRRVWPLRGAAFLVLAFLTTILWLTLAAIPIAELLGEDHPYGQIAERAPDWLEPLVALLGGIGAFIVVMILIGERIRSTALEAEPYGLGRGLATGYYFNLIRPLIGALRDPDNGVHASARDLGCNHIAGVIIGIPEALPDFEAHSHVELYRTLTGRTAKPFVISDLRIELPGRRPRPVMVKLAVANTGVGVIIDVPTTLAVIPDFALELARRSPGVSASGDDRLAEARAEFVAASEMETFQKELGKLLERLLVDFRDVVLTTSAREARPSVTLLHVVSLPRMRRRMDDLVGY